MLHKSRLITATLMLIAVAFALSAPFASAGILAQATELPMQLDSTPTPAAMPMSGARLEANGATLKIASPAAGATINDTSVMVRVQTTNLALGADGVHFHLYVDGKVQGMSEGASSAIMAHDLTPGEHTLEVVLANGLHQEMNASDMIKINVKSASADTVSNTTDSSALLIIGVVAAAVVIGGVGFAITRRK